MENHLQARRDMKVRTRSIGFFMAATLFLTCGSAGRAELKCSSYDAVYEPKVGNTISPNFSNMHMRETTYKLTLTVKPIPDVPGGWGPFAYLDLNTYGDDEELKSTFRMTFGCSGGSMPSCGASMPSSPPKNSGRVTRLEIAGLKRDFSSTGIAVSPNNARSDPATS